jgi:indolepyruvate decarboxylase
MGTQLTDMNLGAAKPQVLRERSVWATAQRVNVSFHTYTDVMLRDFVNALAKARLPRFRERIRYYDNLKPVPKSRLEPRKRPEAISINDLLVGVNDFLAEHHGYDVFAESGDMLFGGLEVRQRGGALYFAQGYYASMGVLLNNGGWGIFRPVTTRKDLLEIPPWPYAELAQAWGGVGFRVTSPGELRDALRAAHEVKGFAIVECIVPPTDISPVSRRYIQASARRSRTARR